LKLLINAISPGRGQALWAVALRRVHPHIIAGQTAPLLIARRAFIRAIVALKNLIAYIVQRRIPAVTLSLAHGPLQIRRVLRAAMRRGQKKPGVARAAGAVQKLRAGLASLRAILR
jgi:hypothetical protein